MNGRYMRAAEIRWHKRPPERLRHIHQKKEKKKVSTVQIFDADLRFVNEIPLPNTLAGIQYADQLAAENPGRLSASPNGILRSSIGQQQSLRNAQAS